MKTVFRVASAGLALFVAGLLFIHFSPDYGFYMVRSESMKPAIEMGDMIVTGPAGGVVSPEIVPGAIVTYDMGGSLVTHRVVAVEGSTLTTRGDAVEDPDSQPVAMSQVVGVYLFRIPRLGYLYAFMHTKQGLVLLFILAAVFVASIIREIVRESRHGAQCEPGR